MSFSPSSSKGPFRGRENIKRKIAEIDEEMPEKKQKKETRRTRPGSKENIAKQESPQGYITRSVSKAENKPKISRKSQRKLQLSAGASRFPEISIKGSRDETGLFRLQSDGSRDGKESTMDNRDNSKTVKRSRKTNSAEADSRSRKANVADADTESRTRIRTRSSQSFAQVLDFSRTKTSKKVVRRASARRTRKSVIRGASKASTVTAKASEVPSKAQQRSASGKRTRISAMIGASASEVEQSVSSLLSSGYSNKASQQTEGVTRGQDSEIDAAKNQFEPKATPVHRIVECGVRADGTVCRCVTSSDIRKVVDPIPSVPSTSSSMSVNLPLSEPDLSDEDLEVDDDDDDLSELSFSSGGFDSTPPFLADITSDDSDGYSEGETFVNDSSDIDDDIERISAPASRLHRCTVVCPFGCRGNRRPSEVTIFEGISSRRLLSSDMNVSVESPAFVDLTFKNCKKVGGKGARKAVRQTTSMSNKTQTTFSRSIFDSSSPDCPQRVAVVFNKPRVPTEEALKHAWNPQDRSFNIRVKEDDPFTIRRQPVAQSTDSARTLQGYSKGLHVFEIIWPLSQRGTHASVGVATNMQTLHSIGYSSLIGLSAESWGWDIGRLKAYHNSVQESGFKYPTINHSEFTQKRRFFMALDCDAGTLGFISGGKWLGTAHSNLQGKLLYPSVSSVWGHCEISLRYHGGSEEQVPKLSELCRVEIRRRCQDFSSLPIPGQVKKFLNYDQ